MLEIYIPLNQDSLLKRTNLFKVSRLGRQGEGKVPFVQKEERLYMHMRAGRNLGANKREAK